MSELSWPDGKTVPGLCPCCGFVQNVDIEIVRDYRDYRPVDCDECLSEYQLNADGSTVIISQRPKETTEMGRALLKLWNQSPVVFDPNDEKNCSIPDLSVLLGPTDSR